MSTRRFPPVLILSIIALIVAFTLTGGVSLSQSGSRAWSALNGKAPSFEGANGWINSPALSDDALRGKVVLVEFWTYSCINWIRTLPYVRGWASKYEGQELVVIGVHSPEFSFEHDIANVRKAAIDLDVDYPIAVDSNLAVWDAFGNQYWPAIYVIDAKGKIRHRQFGEGGYAETERVIQRLLAEAGKADVPSTLLAPASTGAEAPADWSSLRSPETYLGTYRAQRFVPARGIRKGQAASYKAPANLQLNQWGLAGDWTARPEALVLNKPGGRIVYRFHARDVHMVLGSESGKEVRFKVRIDGQAPGDAAGSDVDAAGLGTVSARRMYQLLRQDQPVEERLFDIEFLEPGAEAYAFTFG